MKTMLKNIAMAIASIAMLSIITQVQATSTDVVLDLEGNPTCSSLGLNSEVLSFKDGSPTVGTEANPEVYDLPTPYGSQRISYHASDGSGLVNCASTTPSGCASLDVWTIESVTDDGVTYLNDIDGAADFAEKVWPINYVILKAQGGNKGARVFHFGAEPALNRVPGAIEDEEEEATSPTLAALSFCYGLTMGYDPEAPPKGPSIANLPACGDLSDSTGDGIEDLFTTGIICPVGGEEQLIINLALNDANFGQDADTFRACTCNTTMPSCNPELPAQEVSGTGQYIDEAGDLVFDDDNNPVTSLSFDHSDDRTCLEWSATSGTSGIPKGVNERVPFQILGVENPASYLCEVFDGTRYCWYHY
jgi:hypothetical protein